MTAAFKDQVLAKLWPLGDVVCRAMFGGYGLYLDGRFFGIIHQDRLFFKTDDVSIAAYRVRGMAPFTPYGDKASKTYFEVPPEVQGDGATLLDWAKTAASIPAKPKTRRRRSLAST